MQDCRNGDDRRAVSRFQNFNQATCDLIFCHQSYYHTREEDGDCLLGSLSLPPPQSNHHLEGYSKRTTMAPRISSWTLAVVVAAASRTCSAFVPNSDRYQRRFFGEAVAPSLSSLSATHTPPGSLGTGDGWIDPSAPVCSEASLKLTLEKSLEGSNFQKRLSILGSTGSIGTQTLQIVDVCPNNFVVDALSAGNNAKLMSEQVLKYHPKIAALATVEAAQELKQLLKDAGCTEMPDIVWGDEGIVAAATVASADTVVTGIVGAAGLQPTIEAIKLKKDIALANKETLISGGPVINPLVEKYGINMVRNDDDNGIGKPYQASISQSVLIKNVVLTLFVLPSFLRTVNIRPFFNVCKASPKVDCDGSF